MSTLQRLRSVVTPDPSGDRVFGLRKDLVERFTDALRNDPRAQVGFSVVVLFILAAILAPELTPHDPMAQTGPVLQSPDLSSSYPLGTDSYGRGILSRLMYGARISLAVGLGAVAFGAFVGILMGTVAGYHGGRVDDLLMRTVDIIWAFPWLLTAIMLVAIFGQGFWNVMFAVGFAYIDDFARIARGEVLSIREEEYVMAAKSIGMADMKIMFDEMFPNMIAPIIVQVTIFVASAIIAESSLSFLGLGVKPTTPTWGALLGQGRAYMQTAWWISTIPGLAIVVTVLGINLFGDALRDAFDVKEV